MSAYDPIFVQIGSVIFDLSSVIFAEKKQVAGLWVIDVVLVDGVTRQVPTVAVDRVWGLLTRRVQTATEPDRS